MTREPRRDRLGREAYLLAELAAQRLSTQLDDAVRTEGITAAQYKVLWVLALAGVDDGIPQGAISDGLVTQASDVSRLVSRLVDLGLVERHPSPTDRRVTLVRVTGDGRAVVDRATTRVKGLHRDQFAGLSDDELAQLADLLNRVFWQGVEAAGDQEEAS